MKSQNEAILEYLIQGNTLTAVEALNKFSCFRLASRINDLRRAGANIISKSIKVKNVSGKYVYITEYSFEEQ